MLRLFFAIELPPEVKERLAAARDAWSLDSARWRVVHPDALHLTLRFLGEVDPKQMADLESIGRASTARIPAIPCALGRVGTFPSTGRARVLWVEIADRSSEGDLAWLARELEDRLRAAGFAPESRAFAPHVTLARAKVPARPPQVAPLVPGESFVARGLALVRSHLGPAGSRYELVGSFPLCQDAGGGCA